MPPRGTAKRRTVPKPRRKRLANGTVVVVTFTDSRRKRKTRKG